MLASNPSRNSRPELIADDGQGVFLPARPITWPGPDRNAGLRPRFTRCDDTSDRKIPPCLKKRILGAPSFFMRSPVAERME
jgi:hypothetical protein